MERCPFYGSRWPEKQPELRHVGGNECGLEVQSHAACEMETQGQFVDYFACPVARRLAVMLTTCEHLVRVPTAGSAVTLREWKERYQY